MGLAWQQGPLAAGAAGRFLTAESLPERLLYAEPLRRRMRVRFGGAWIADSQDVVLLHEPGRYPVAYFPLGDIAGGRCSPATTAPSTATSGRRPGMSCRGAGWPGRGRRGSTPGCPATPAS